MRKFGLGSFAWLALATLVAGLTSCGSSGSSAMSDPPPVPQTKHVAVADTGDNRILIYDTPLFPTSSASIAIGQASFTAGKPNQGAATASATSLDSPHGIAMDAAGNLWVADRGNCRVVEFKAPLSTGMSASVLLGQSDWTATGMNGGWGCPFATSITAATMEMPVGMAFDSHGDLWVVDAAASRITEYVPPFTNGMEASLVIGQPDMQSNAPCNGAEEGEHGPGVPPTAATLCAPQNIAFDSNGNLWVTDPENMRVLEYVPPFTTGMAASLVIGQSAMTVFTGNGSCFASASDLCSPTGIGFDGHGNLWVTDWAFNRVTEYRPPFATGMDAALEIGQANFTDQGPYPSAAMEYPESLAFDSRGNLLVTIDFSEILVYESPFSMGMNPATIVSSGLGSCPQPGPSANTLCEPIGEAVF